jgi:cell division protease FtsH
VELLDRLDVLLDAEIRKLLEAAHGRVRDTLTTKRAVLEALAKLLIEREVADRKSLGELLERQRA